MAMSVDDTATALEASRCDGRQLMPTMRPLAGHRMAALAADGFEKVELTLPMRALQLAGAKVDVISLRHGRIRGVNLHMPATRVGVDKTIGEADPGDYDGLLLPGGFINPDLHSPRGPVSATIW